MECLLRLFSADEGIAERVHSRTIVISRWQKIHPSVSLLDGPHLADHRKKLEERDMSTTTLTGVQVLVRPSEYAFVTSMALNEGLGNQHIIYDARVQDEIFQSVMDMHPKQRPKLNHLEFIEIPDTVPYPDISTNRNISVYEAGHNARCVRGSGYSESRSFTKYQEYLKRCEFFAAAPFGLEAMTMVAKAQEHLHREKRFLEAQAQLTVPVTGVVAARGQLHQPKLFLESLLPAEVVQRKTLCERKFFLMNML
jgi:hypothetical protein